MKKLLTGIVALTVAGCASAQAYDAYDARGRYIGNGSIYRGIDGSRGVRRGNIGWTYDANGRHVRTWIRRGNMTTVYDASGRVTARGYISRDGSSAKAYDARGRYIGSVTR
jgi:YD repeat-containing protein